MSLFQQNSGDSVAKPSGGGLFSKSKKPQPQDVVNVDEEINSINRKMSLIEDRYSNLRKKTNVSEQNLISYNKRIRNEIKTINSELLDLRRLINSVDSKLLLIIKEIKHGARKEEVDLIKKYVNLWEPIKFVTRKEVETIIKDHLEDMNIK